jgi:hypothetical protein
MVDIPVSIFFSDSTRIRHMKVLLWLSRDWECVFSIAMGRMKPLELFMKPRFVKSVLDSPCLWLGLGQLQKLKRFEHSPQCVLIFLILFKITLIILVSPSFEGFEYNLLMPYHYLFASNWCS